MKSKSNDTTIYLKHTIKTDWERIKQFFVQAYIDCDFILEKPKRSLIYVTKIDESRDFRRFDSYLRSNENYYSVYFLAKTAIYVFQYPGIYQNDIDLFYKGKYSKMSDTFKQLILSQYRERMSEEKVKQLKVFAVLYPNQQSRLKLAEKLGVRLGVDLAEDCELKAPPNKGLEVLDRENMFQIDGL